MSKIHGSKSETAFRVINGLFMFILAGITLYPLLYVVFGSFSDPAKLSRFRGALLKPMGFSLKGYEAVFSMKNFWLGYRNTLFYVAAGTAISMLLTILGAYALSVKGYMLNKPVMFLIVFTMYFSGGMIPTYLVVKQIGFVDTIWSVLIPGCISVYNLIVLRSSFQSIPRNLIESASIDGAGHIRILFRIVLPLSSAALATITLFYGASRWGAWYSAMVYLPNRRDLYPLQMFLRELMVTENNMDAVADEFSTESANFYLLKNVIKYAAVIVSTVPILCLYPFLQKYFIKGVLVGSLKE